MHSQDFMRKCSYYWGRNFRGFSKLVSMINISVFSKSFNHVMEPQCITPNKNFQIRQIIGKTAADTIKNKGKSLQIIGKKNKSAKTSSIMSFRWLQTPTNLHHQSEKRLPRVGAAFLTITLAAAFFVLFCLFCLCKRLVWLNARARTLLKKTP